MTIDDKIRDEKLQHNINREAAKALALSSGRIDKYEYPTGEEVLSSYQRGVTEQGKFTYSPLRKALENQIKTIENQGIKQVKALKALKSEENQKLESIEGLFTKKTYKHKTNRYSYDFQQFETIRSFIDSIYTKKLI